MNKKIDRIMREWKVGLITIDEAYEMIEDSGELDIIDEMYLSETMEQYAEEHGITW